MLFLALVFSNNAYAQDPYLGEIKLVPYYFAPQGWAECNGQILSISQYSALFSLLGTTYGGDGVSTFALPDLRSRVPIHVGTGPGLPTYQLGQTGGTPTNTLVANNLPQHVHPVNAILEDGDQPSPAGALLANTKTLDGEYKTSGATTQMNSAMIGTNATTNQAVNNVQPFLVLRYIIALQGTYPSQSRSSED